MDAPGSAAVIAQLVDVASRVSGAIYKYSVAVKHARADVLRLQAEVNSFQAILTELTHTESLPLACEAHVRQCNTDLQALLKILERGVEKTGGEAWKGQSVKTLYWPFHVEKNDKYLAMLARHKASISVSLNTRSVQSSVQLLKDSREIKAALAKVHLDFDDQSTVYWLDPPDVTIYLDSAISKRSVESTGSWLYDNADFNTWFTTPASLLWLDGIPGAGKTILCSSIIAGLSARASCIDAMALAYFFFDSSNPGDTNSVSMLRSFIWQIASSSEVVKSALEGCHSRIMSEKQRTNPVGAFLDTLHSMLSVAGQVYLVIDALDESPDRKRLISIWHKIIGWKLPNLHILITCREVSELDQDIGSYATSRMVVGGEGIASDIDKHVTRVVETDKRLSRWPDHIRKTIHQRLTSNAGGTFRWVQCQLDTLSQCLTRRAITKALDRLPPTLHGVYEKILRDIYPEHKACVRRILLWLSCATRPMTLEEVADAAALDSVSLVFDEEERILPVDISFLCPGLITVEPSRIRRPRTKPLKWHGGKNPGLVSGDPQTSVMTIKIAHASVRDYLLSDEIQHGDARYFRLQSSHSASHLSIAQMCTVYMEHCDQFESIDVAELAEHMPLCLYAAQFWSDHARLAYDTASGSEPTTTFAEFLQRPSFRLALRIFSPEILKRDRRSFGQENPAVQSISSMYFASLFGLTDTVKELIGNGGSVNENGGALGSPLHAATFGAHIDTAELLIKAGANCNAWSEEVGSVLQLAAAKSLTGLVRVLLGNGADPTAKHSGVFGSALVAASFSGNLEIVRALLTNTRVFEKQEKIALLVACYAGHVEIVRCMLGTDLDVNEHSEIGHALSATLMPVYQRASEREEIVRMLLDHGADVNPLPVKQTWTVVEAESMSGEVSTLESLVKSILTKFIDPDDQLNSTWAYGDIPYESMLWNHEPYFDRRADITLLEVLEHCSSAFLPADRHLYQTGEISYGSLIDHGDNLRSPQDRKLYDVINRKKMSMLRDRLLDIPLAAACRSQNANIVRMLIAKGAVVHACSPTLLGLATPRMELMEVLVDAGAQVAQSSSTALSKAVRYGDMELLRWLIAHGASIDASPEQKALRRSRKDVQFVHDRIVIEYPVKDVSCIGDAPPLIHACQKGYVEMVELLLDSGADVQVTSLQWGSGLHAAAMLADPTKRKSLVQRLLHKGANPSALHNVLGLPIHVAIHQDDVELARILARAGTNLGLHSHPQKPSYTYSFDRRFIEGETILMHEGFCMALKETLHAPLQYAIWKKHNLMTQTLLQNGASVSTPDPPRLTALAFLLSFGWSYDFLHSPWGSKDEILSFINILQTYGCHFQDPCGGPFEHPLQAAVGFRMSEVLDYLIHNGALVNAHGGRYGSALSAAASFGWKEGMNLLLDAGADPNLFGQPSSVTNKNATWDLGSRDSDISPLANAAKHGFTDTVKRLLAVGATDNVTENGQSKVIRLAIDERHLDTVQLLLDAGHKADPTEGNDLSALQRCLRTSKAGKEDEAIELIRFLLARGANASVYDSKAPAPLTQAAALGFETVVELLQQHDAKSPIRQYSVCCPVCSAIRANAKESMIKMLIKYQCNIDHDSTYATRQSLHSSTTSHWVETVAPIHSAAFVHSPRILRLLLSAGASSERHGPGSQSVAHTALENGRRRHVSDGDSLELLKVLREFDVNMTVVADNHGTPLKLAISELKVQCVLYLLHQTRATIEQAELERLRVFAFERFSRFKHEKERLTSQPNQAIRHNAPYWSAGTVEEKTEKASQILDALETTSGDNAQ